MALFLDFASAMRVCSPGVIIISVQGLERTGFEVGVFIFGCACIQGLEIGVIVGRPSRE